jgi:hypothetical protein
VLFPGFFAAASAAADGIQVTIDRPEATVEDQLVLSVAIEGSQRAQPELPDLSAFEVYSRGSSRQFTSVNGRATTSVTYTYVLIPKRTGTFTIGAATVELDGRTYQSQPFQVKVLEASAEPQESRDLFTRASVSTTRPYVGQQVIYTWRFYRRVRVGDARLEPQDFQGMLIEDLGEVREYQTTVNGQQYFVSEIRKAIFPQEPGSLEVPGSRLTCQVAVRSARRGLLGEFLGASETKVLRTRPIELDVQPLPPTPAGFSGLVGSFDLDASISKTELAVGESATLEVKISGDGNPQLIAEPELDELSGFKTYADKPSSAVNRSGSKLRGSKTFKTALVPLVPGELTVPGMELVYFDPESGSYRTDRTDDIVLQVKPSEGEEELRLTEALAPTTGKVAVRILADDILPLHRGLDALDVPWTRRTEWLLPVGLALPLLAYLAVMLLRRRREAYERDSGLRRRRGALRSAQRCLKEVGEGGEAAPEASRCLRRYIGDKLGAEGTALTPAECGDLLRQAQVDDEAVTETVRLLNRLEAAQYGAGAVRPDQLQAELESLLQRLDKQIKTGQIKTGQAKG